MARDCCEWIGNLGEQGRYLQLELALMQVAR
jgi:hypothetical protein